MLEWIGANLSTILISIVLIAIIIWIIYGMIKNWKSGKSSCGGNCSDCGGCAYHHSDTSQSKQK